MNKLIQQKPKQKMARYEMHKYWGKKPSNHLFELIQKYTNEGDIVLDPFAGYGVFVCEAYLNGRNAIGNDLNPVASFIQDQLLNDNLSLSNFSFEIDKVIAATKELERYWYGEICPKCNADLIVTATLRLKDGSPTKNKVLCLCTKSSFEYEISAAGKANIINKEKSERLINHPVAKLIRNGRISAFDNMTTDDLFTIRALASHAALFAAIDKIDATEIRDLARFAFTSNLANCSKLVPPISSRGEMAPGAWMTGFYTGDTYIENNVFHYFKNRVSKIVAGKLDYYNENRKLGSVRAIGKANDVSEFTDKTRGYIVDNNDTKHLKYPDNAIDYVFTDPPYGDTVPYFEQSVLWNTWLGKDVDYDNEVVISDSKERQKKDNEFAKDIKLCVNEIWRVLKTGKYFSITFHSLSGDEWYALMHACLEIGFVYHDIVLMEQKTFAPRQLNRKMTVKGDMLLTLKKPDRKPKVKYLDEEKTISFVISEVTNLLKVEKKNTNDVYVHILKSLLLEHAIFAKSNFLKILMDNFRLSEDGYWTVGN
jgi:DNA modification methylase